MSGVPFDDASYNHSVLVWSGFSSGYTREDVRYVVRGGGCVLVVRGDQWFPQLFFGCLRIVCVCIW
jgi:hypothetical protein